MQAALPPIPAKRPSPRFPPCGPGNVATSSLPISLRSPGRSLCGSFPLALAVKKIPRFGKQTLCAAGARLRERQKCARPVPVLRTATGGLPRVMVRSPVAQRAAVFSLHGGGWPPATEVWSKRNGAACKTPGRKLLPKPGLGARDRRGSARRARPTGTVPKTPRRRPGRRGRSRAGDSRLFRHASGPAMHVTSGAGHAARFASSSLRAGRPPAPPRSSRSALSTAACVSCIEPGAALASNLP